MSKLWVIPLGLYAFWWVIVPSFLAGVVVGWVIKKARILGLQAEMRKVARTFALIEGLHEYSITLNRWADALSE